ncbi:DUF4249 domain-containing protein [Arcicella aquatica]|uniref:DUF4249 domain-containing protein n=1 Tax=Arcicella aquatica TaxID=217141 RepID=A0ABU5QRS2_9BACT|nr:DUF4249 domain-containing protein [Arcicella aquatica]MEA5259782.1 DUF4249 domain-containing protein [Arcicella aquatica]
MMAMKRFIIYFLLFSVGFWSCITEIRDFEQIDSAAFLTVEATLSNQKGPHKVVLSFSSPSIKINVDNVPVKNAQVFITDDKGGRETLSETDNGIYVTSATYQGVVGNAYTLHINLSNGKKYESSPEILKAAPAIDTVKYQFSVKDNYPLTDSRSVGFDVTLDFKDSPEADNYYQWKWTHYERTVFCASCERGYDYSLKKCSIEQNFPQGQTFPELINYGCNETCFDISFNETYNILSDKLMNGQQVTNYPIARVPYNNKSIYYLKIEQRAISEKMFRYFRSIKDVTQGSGTLFDVPAETQFSPNMVSLSDPNEKILGAFQVFGSQEKIIYVDRQIGTLNYSPVLVVYQGRVLPPPPGAISGPKAYCVEGKYRTKTEPEAFKE